VALNLASVDVFGEGVWRSEGVVVGTDGFVYGGGRNGVMYRVDPDGKVEEIATLAAGSKPNGLAMDRNGDIIICDVGISAVSRLTQAGKLSLIADRVEDVVLKTPNFATFDADGNLYVSNTLDRSLKELSAEPPDMYDPVAKGALVRIRPNGRADVVAREIHWANGTAIDPKEEAIYVLQTNKFNCLRIPIRKDGGHGKPEIYAEDFPACPDGMAFAADGTLFVTLPGTIKKPGDIETDSLLTTANKIIKIDTSGAWELLLHDPESAVFHNPTNCAFGGGDMHDLYFTNLLGTHFCKIHTELAGHPLYHQR